VRTGLAIALLASSARAGEPSRPATSFDEATARLQLGETVLVTRPGGELVRGRLESTHPLRLARPERIEPGGDRATLSEALLELAESDVERLEVQRRDPIWNGTLTGFAVGAAVILAADCNSPWCDGIQPLLVSGVLVLATGAGALIDALTHERELLYAADPPGACIAVLPLVDRHRRGLIVTLSWGR
jgi:hypothetical protein